MKYVLWALLILLGLILLLLLIALLRTLLTAAKKSLWQPKRDPAREDLYAEILARMVRCETVSAKGEIRREKFLTFHKELAALFPLAAARLDWSEIDGSLLIRWKGKGDARPLVLMAHQDVVPAEGEWLHEPFSGDVEGGRIWGRGSADDKSALMAIFQAIEELLAEGYEPAQDVYLSASNTEEVGGEGCPKLVAELKRRGVKPFLVWDEGGSIVTEPMAGIPGYYAMVGILEKGQGNLLISARSGGGHSSYPAQNSPIARLARFICAIEKKNPMKARMTPALKNMLESLGAYGPFHFRLLFGNLWLFGPLLLKLMPKISPQAAALTRTTVAFTMQKGSDGCNVMPQEATLNINLRYMPHQDMTESNAIIRQLARRYNLSVSEVDAYPACQPIDREGEAFRLAQSVIHEVFPELPLVPYIMTGGTDARFYEEICSCCVRFAPVVYGPDQMKGMHGLNEYLDAYSLPGAVDFFRTLIKRNQ